MTTREQLDSFYQFASGQLESCGTELSLDEIYQVWRARHLTGDDRTDSISAVQAASADLDNGDTGRPAREVLQDACERLGLVIDE